MGRVLVLGEAAEVEGYALAGAEVLVAEDPGEVVRAWSSITSSDTLVVLTSRAADALDQAPPPVAGVLAVVMAP